VRRLHQQEQDKFPDERLSIEGQIVQMADKVIAECPQDKQDLVHLYEADPGKLAMIPCGFNPQELQPVDKQYARMVLGLHPDEKIILQLGRIVPRKGIDNVIRAVSLLPASCGTVRLLVAGGESETPDPQHEGEFGRLQEIAAEAGVAASATFTG